VVDAGREDQDEGRVPEVGRSPDQQRVDQQPERVHPGAERDAHRGHRAQHTDRDQDPGEDVRYPRRARRHACHLPPTHDRTAAGYNWQMERSQLRRRLGWGTPPPAGGLAAATLALLPARTTLSLASVALLYLLPVVATAAV